jgi:Flp pilus assembly protein TadG
MRRHRLRRRDERGSVSIWLVTSSFVMMVLVGLAVDLSGQVHAQQRAHDVAAQAARAGGQQVQASAAIQGDPLSVDVGAARAAAQRFLAASEVAGSVSISGGDTITVHVTDNYEPRFLGLIGIHNLHVTGKASARLVRSLGGTEQ